MIDRGEEPRDLDSLVVPLVGSLVATGDPWEPYGLRDRDGVPVVPVSVYLKDLQACGRSASTQRSYGMDLLRWFRFLWAIEVGWDQVTRAEARDFSLWIQLADKPTRPHWRTERDGKADKPAAPRKVTGAPRPGTPNPVTGKPPPGRKYAATTRAHSESVLRHFYEFHLGAETGPMVNPFPLARGRGGRRVGAHHSPMDSPQNQRSGLFRPRLGRRVPRSIPDEKFNELFAQLSSHRDRALVAFWISTGARASELLGVRQADVDPGQQLITVIRKGSRALQQLPASPDAFVWLRLYQEQMHGLTPVGRDDPVWWTLRRPFRALTYHAAYRMFHRANDVLGANWSLHDLRHSAAYRMARDPDLPLVDVQWVLGHAHLSTTQLYLTPVPQDVIASILAHHDRRDGRGANPSVPQEQLPPRYRSETLDVLFGGTHHDRE